MERLPKGPRREITKAGTPRGGLLQPVRQILADVARLLGGDEAAQTAVSADPQGEDARLQPYPEVSREFEAGIGRIIQARANTEGKIDVNSSRELSRDVAHFLVGLSREFYRNSREPEGAPLLLLLKTIAIERAKAFFDEPTRVMFIGQLDHAILVEQAHSLRR